MMFTPDKATTVLPLLAFLFLLDSVEPLRFNLLTPSLDTAKCKKNLQNKSSLPLFAKKKGPKIVSDEFLQSLETLDAEESATKSSQTGAATLKDKKLGKLGISSDILSTFIEEEDFDSASAKNKKKKEKKAKKGRGGADSGDDHEDGESAQGQHKSVHKDENGESEDENEDDAATEEVDPSAPTLEMKARREKPSSKIRFAESAQPGYVMMGLEGVGVMYGNSVVLKDATFSVTTGERVGLVGPNGGGKSTQLKILAGELEATYGSVVKSSADLRVAFLRQEFEEQLELDRTLKEELLDSFRTEREILMKIAEAEQEVEQTTNDPAKMELVLNRLQKLQDEAISKGAYALESKVEKIMDATGFSKEDAGALVRSFSGGWKMRITIAKILLQDPNILLLDEPTNHMDLDSVMWLEDFLPKQNLPMVIVSHDREFLDRVCNKIVDVEEGATVSYKGNYSKFLEQKRLRLEQWKEKYDKQTRYVREEERAIKKAKGDPSMAQQAKAKAAALEKFKKSEEWVEAPPKDKRFRFRFPPPPRCGDRVLEVSKLTHGYGTGKYETLFKDVDFVVERGNRIGFIGPNGSGKSTMMRIIHGLEEPRDGYAEHSSSSVVDNYFAQNQADALDLSKTVLEVVQEGAPSEYTLTDIRGLLGQFIFKGDDVYKKIGVLSGGEKARVALCKMMLTPANLLLLDEPTNHLDITSKEVLEDALLNYAGSVLIISHDRYFMSQVVNTIFSFHDRTVERFDCDYHDYMEAHVGGLKEKVVGRYVSGDRYKITNAKEVVVQEEKSGKKKNFGGSGVTSGNLFKGIKNAKRYAGNP